MKTGLIYCLRDPFTNEVRYVGFTSTTMKNRFSQHKHDALKKQANTYKDNWFRKCVANGMLPIIELLEDDIPIDKWEEKESYYIAEYDNLTNQRGGGAGIIVDRTTTSIERSTRDKRKPVVQLTLDNKYINTFESIRDAERSLDSGLSRIRLVCQNKAVSALGYKWCYKDQYELGVLPDYTDARDIRHNSINVTLFDIETNQSLGEFDSKAKALKSVGEKSDCYVRKDGTIKGKYRLEEIKI